MTETGAVLYTQFVICCRKIIRSQGSAACWYKTLSSRAFIKRGPSRSHAVSSEGDLFPISIYVHEKNDAVDKPDTPDVPDVPDGEGGGTEASCEQPRTTNAAAVAKSKARKR